jgi:rubrerythrin
MKRLFSIPAILLTLLTASLSTSCNQSAEPKKIEQKEEKTLYQCPMDCEKGVTHDQPGQCPVCGMDLEKTPAKS